MKTVDPNDPNLVLSPLADPVVGAIFDNVEVAGLASHSVRILQQQGAVAG